MKRIIACLIIALIGLSTLSALSMEDVKTVPKAVLFNVPNLLMGVEEYQGGIGVKITKEKWHLRLMLDLLLDIDGENPGTDVDDFDYGLGAAAEYHLSDGKISPYLGLGLSFLHDSDKSVTDSDNWSKDYWNTLSLGPILGTEVKIMENVSLFAEYQLSLDFVGSGNTTNTAGTKTKTANDLQWQLGLDLGNQALIGVAVYLP